MRSKAGASSISGSGSGRDVYALAQLVGPKGEVVGVDMTDEQIAVATAHVEWHRKKFGYQQIQRRVPPGLHRETRRSRPQAQEFRHCHFELRHQSVADKLAVLKGAYDLLKPGGEMYFSDVYADRRLPDAVRNDPVLYGECLGGALYWNDFHALAKQAGFRDPRLVEDRPLAVTDERLAGKTRPAKFYLCDIPAVQTR